MADQIKVAFSKPFMAGFVQRCFEMGMGETETEDTWKKYANNHILAQPNVYKGFRAAINAPGVPLTKAAMSRYLQPDILSAAVETHIKFASTPWAMAMRSSLGLPDPSWDNVPEETRKIASQMSGLLHQFDTLPMQQQILLSSLAGAGVGALKRSVLPTAEDEMAGRGVMSRAGRGALRGGAIGAGVGVGRAAGGEIGLRLGAQNKDNPLIRAMQGRNIGSLVGGAGAAAMF